MKNKITVTRSTANIKRTIGGTRNVPASSGFNYGALTFIPLFSFQLLYIGRLRAHVEKLRFSFSFNGIGEFRNFNAVDTAYD